MSSPTLEDDMLFKRVIGQGNQATISLCTARNNLDERNFAVKTYKLSTLKFTPK